MLRLCCWLFVGLAVSWYSIAGGGSSLCGAENVLGEENPAPRGSSIDCWLQAGPLPVPVAAFEDRDNKTIAKDLLDAAPLGGTSYPEEGARLPWAPCTGLEWLSRTTLEGALVFDGAGVDAGDPTLPRIAFAAAYLSTTRWQEVTFEVRCTRPCALFVDGEEKGRGLRWTAAADDKPQTVRASCPLIRGKHRIWIESVALPGAEATSAPWTLSLRVEPGGENAADTLSFSLSPRRTFADMNAAKGFSSVGSFALSPFGERLALVLSDKSSRPGHTRRSLLILEMPTGDVVDRLDASSGMSDLSWSPDGTRLAFKTKGRLDCYEPGSRRFTTIVKGVKGLGKYMWGPDSAFVCFAAQGAKPEPQGDHVRLEGIHQRLTDYSETKTLHLVSVGGEARHTLTRTGHFAIEDFALAPDGKKIVFVKRYPIEGRPFFRTEFWMLSLPHGDERLVLTTSFPFENMPQNLTFSPDGQTIAFTGPPAQIVGDDDVTEHNFFETDLWLLDLASGRVERLSDRFDEGVEAPLFWHPTDGHIYFTAHSRTQKQLSRIAVEGEGSLERLHESPRVVHTSCAAAGGRGLAFTGSSIDAPAALYAIDLEEGQTRLLLDPNERYMQQFMLGRWEPWSFENTRGQKIDGFLFYPPDFEESQVYPLMVYYYGGTSPEVERFSVTYYHFMPANGYMQYVVNPAGAVGYGEAFSDLHVNDWGELAAADIIEGVEALLKEKTFIDSERVAGYGGSYGGFMTLSLITKTDRFKASCSLYGISNLASYWGAGIWGYTYGDTAMARSYPWTRPDIFVERSPLYHADKVRSALLLMHGTDDVNVPSVESEQMFTALQVLGKEAAYVRFPGEDHGIGSSLDIYILHRRMMLEWFDKHLKGEPEAWEARWR